MKNREIALMVTGGYGLLALLLLEDALTKPLAWYGVLLHLAVVAYIGYMVRSLWSSAGSTEA